MIIGITGGIGSGKSTIARELARRSYTVYDCDREAKRIIVENPDVRAAIIALLGEEAFIQSATTNDQSTITNDQSIIYNTSYVAQRVFSSSLEGRSGGVLDALNAIIHPAVKEDICQRSGLSAKRSGSHLKAVCQAEPVLFLESAILYESGFDTLCDRIIVIDAPEEIRIARVIARDFHDLNTTANIEKVRARIRTQHPHTGDLLINNDGLASIESLADQILNYLSAQL